MSAASTLWAGSDMLWSAVKEVVKQLWRGLILPGTSALWDGSVDGGAWLLSEVVRPTMDGGAWLWADVMRPGASALWLVAAEGASALRLGTTEVSTLVWTEVMWPCASALLRYLWLGASEGGAWLWADVMRPGGSALWLGASEGSAWLWADVMRPGGSALWLGASEGGAWLWADVMRPGGSALWLVAAEGASTLWLSTTEVSTLVWTEVMRPCASALSEVWTMVLTEVMRPCASALLRYLWLGATEGGAWLWADVMPPAVIGGMSVAPLVVLTLLVRRTWRRGAPPLQRRHQAQPSSDCPVCMENHPPTEMLTFACGHSVCRPCATRFLELKVQDGETVITCPSHGCHHLIGREEVMPLLPLKLRRRFAELAEERRVRRQAADEMVHALVRSGRLQICPGCRNGVEKSDDACDHIHCVCGADFCWACGADYNGEQGIRHVGNSAHKRTCRHWREPGR